MAMRNPKVSVIIPAYNGAELIGQAIQSVLGQTYTNLELIVVDDASPDHTREVVRQFDDPRLKCIVHEKNQGAMVARNTALHASTGELIALLDQDDLYHPEKLETHVAFLEANPEIGVTVNGRFEMEGTPDKLRGIWQAPLDVSLTDMILGFPFAPSDTLFRRQWAMREDIWETVVVHGKEAIFNGGEYVYCGRLSFAGCKFASIERALNYRRYYPGRILSDLKLRCESELACQRIILEDPRCPPEVSSVRNIAFSNTYLDWAFHAFAQNETALAQTFLQEAIRLTPSIVEDVPSRLVTFMVDNSIIDESRNHEAILRDFFSNLPSEAGHLSAQLSWAVARSHLLKGTNQVMWGRLTEAQGNLALAAELGAKVDEPFVQRVTALLMIYENEFGLTATQAIIRNLTPYLKKIGGSNSLRRLRSHYSINRAFRSFDRREYDRVPSAVFHAVANNPAFLLNRGVLSILARSIAGQGAA